MYFGSNIFPIDITYIIFILPAILLGVIAQMMVKSRFAKYSKVPSRKGISGAAAAQFLLKKNGIEDVKIAHIGGSLTDNYNPLTRVLSLSDSTFQSTSIAAIGVAAHETGHAIQHRKKYPPLIIRRALVPVANFGSKMGPLLAIGSVAFSAGIQSDSYTSLFQLIAYIGLILYAASVLFYIVTLPVEFNASHRALVILKKTGVFDEEEIKSTRKVLNAAALTYVASALSSVLSLLRLLLIVLSRSNRSQRNRR